MSEWTRAQIIEAWVSIKDQPGLMDRMAPGERIFVPVLPSTPELPGWDKGKPQPTKAESPRIEFSGRLEDVTEEGGWCVVRSGSHVVTTAWVSKSTPK